MVWPMNNAGSAIGAHLRLRGEPSQRRGTACRCKMRMSGLSKVEMSAFIGGRGRYGDGANGLEPTRTGPARCATEADHPEGSGPPTEDQRPAHPSIAGWSEEAR